MSNKLTISDLRADPDRLLTQRELADPFNKSPAWFERHRWAGTGVPFIKIGRSVFYRAGDALDWLDARRVQTVA